MIEPETLEPEFCKILKECYPNDKDIIQRFSNKVDSFDGKIYYIFEGDILVGGCFVIEQEKLNTFYITGMAIKPSIQHQGYGTKLIKDILSKRTGIFLLRTRSAKLFYEDLGFVELKNIDGVSIMALTNGVINV